MTIKFAIAAAYAVAAAALASAAAADSHYVWISEQGDFAETFIGPKITDPEDANNYFVIEDDGKIVGTWYGNKLEGEWRWDAGYFCRTLSAPRPAPEDCQEWSLGDGDMRLVRDRGQGESTLYTLSE